MAMKYGCFIIMSLFLFLTIDTVGQESYYSKTNEYNLGVGYIEYKNTVAVPSGLPGTSTFFEYKKSYVKSNNKNHNFDFNIKTEYAYMKRNNIISDVNIPYHHVELISGVKWSWNIPKGNSNLLINYGIGLSFSTLVGINKNLNFSSVPQEIMYPYGNWHLSPDLHLGFNYRLNKLLLSGGISIPVFVIGFFQEFEYFDYYIDDTQKFMKYVIIPNTFALATQYRDIKNFISVQNNISETQTNCYSLKLLLNHDYLNARIFNNN
ncbi:hypothetical protein MASR2M117_10030 [Paludibacter sp.]